MTRELVRRTVAVGVAGAVGAAAVVAFIRVANDGASLGQSALGPRVDWFLLVLAGAGVAALVWVLARMFNAAAAELPADLGMPSSCAECGGAVLDAWRLCPHCGELLKR